MMSMIRRRLSAMGSLRAPILALIGAATLTGCGGAVRDLLTDTKVAYSLDRSSAECAVGEPTAACQDVKIYASKRHDGSNEVKPYYTITPDTAGTPSVIDHVDRSVLANGDVQVSIGFRTQVTPGVYTGTIEIAILSFDPFTDWVSNKVRYRLEVGAGEAAHITALPAAVPGQSDWTGFGGTPGRDGHVALSLDPSKFNARWSRWFFSGGSVRGEGLTLGLGRIVLPKLKGDGSADTTTNASVIDLNDGKDLWKAALPDTPTQVIANGDRLYWSTSMGRVLVTSASSGTVLGEHAGKGNTNADPGWTFAGSRLLMPVDPEVNYLSAVETADLRTAWTTTLADRLSNRNYRAWGVTADAAAGLAYANTGGVYRVLALGDGAIQAEAQVPTREDQLFAQIAVYQAPVLPDDGVSAVLLSHRDIDPGSAVQNHLTVVERATGVQRWDATGEFMDHPVAAHGVVYAANQRTKAVEARSLADGTLLWSWPMEAGDSHWQRQMVLTDSHLFVSTNRQTVALDLATRVPVWRTPNGGWLGMTREGVLVVVSQGTASTTLTTVKTFNLR